MVGWSVGRLQMAPWIRTLCTATSINGYECNPKSIQASGYDTGNCSGVPTTNSIRIVNFVGKEKNRAGIRAFQCEKIPNYPYFNTLKAPNYPDKISTAGFRNVKAGDFGAKSPNSRIVKLMGKEWVDCPKHLAGIQKVSESVYLARYNMAPPSWFFKYLPLSAP